MPIYEYICNECKYTVEFLKKLDDNSQELCPKCKSIYLNKIISISNFTLKGKGWYKTDYKDTQKHSK